MKNDLISREGLKKALHNFFDGKVIDEPAYILRDVFCYIESAPTVEPFEPDYVGAERAKARQRGYEQGYHFGMEIGKTLNPKIKQGNIRWVDKLSFKNNGDIIDFEGRVVGHIDLEVMKGGAE